MIYIQQELKCTTIQKSFQRSCPKKTLLLCNMNSYKTSISSVKNPKVAGSGCIFMAQNKVGRKIKLFPVVLDINNEWAALISFHLQVQIRLIKNKLYYITALKTSLSLIQEQMNGYSKFDVYVFTGLIKSQAGICRARQNFLFLQRLLAPWD